MREPVSTWAAKRYRNIEQILPISPVVIFRDNHSIGMGTWIKTSKVSVVLTAKHLFYRHPKPVLYSIQIPGTSEKQFLKKPTLLPGRKNCDVVSATVTRERQPVTVTWPNFPKPESGTRTEFADSIVIKGVLDNAPIILTHMCEVMGTDKIVRDLVGGQHAMTRGPGESGSGFVSNKSSLYILSHAADIGSEHEGFANLTLPVQIADFF